MKRLLLFLMLIFCMSCDPMQNSGQWRVGNDTEQTLKFTYPDIKVTEGISEPFYRTFSITPGGSIAVYDSFQSLKASPPDFDDYFRKIISLHGENISWQVASIDDTVLKTWSYSDRGQSDQRFFEELSWSFFIGEGGAWIDTVFSWTFDIMPEDIQQTNQ